MKNIREGWDDFIPGHANEGFGLGDDGIGIA